MSENDSYKIKSGIMQSGNGWKWYGFSGHFVCGKECAFHLATRIGNYLVSTLGDYRPIYCGGNKRKQIGCDRFFETMVFKCNGDDPNGNANILDWSEIDSNGYNDSRAAEIGHYEMCWKYDEISGVNSSLREFGQIVKDLRGKKRIGLREFCIACNQDPSNWSSFENGTLIILQTKEQIDLIANVLGASEEEKKTLYNCAVIHAGNAETLVDELLQAQSTGVSWLIEPILLTSRPLIFINELKKVEDQFSPGLRSLRSAGTFMPVYKRHKADFTSLSIVNPQFGQE